jgi:hypothetical protein
MTTPPTAAGMPPRRLINSTHASIDYRLDQVGPSGVGKVEIWLTSDQAATWQRIGEHASRHTPIEVDLPGEGLFGIRLVMTNGNGFGGTAPQRGDTPTCWIEVDSTRPNAQLRDVDTQGSGSGVLVINWTATDKNLGGEPIDLYYSLRKEGPWVPLAHGIKNDGSYRWTFPRDLSSQFYVRMDVADLAGNVTHCESATPVILDLTEPRAVVVNITGGANRSATPTGN